MVSAVLVIRTAQGKQEGWFVNAAEARRSLLRQVRKNRWSINGNGKRGVLRSDGPGSPIAGEYVIRTAVL